MPYVYQAEKPKLFTEEGQITFLKIRDHVVRLLRVSGAVRMLEAMSSAPGDSWLRMACIDRMAELGEIVEIKMPGDTLGQWRVFTAGPHFSD